MSIGSPPAARSHTPKGQAVRQRILRAAEALIAARGFYGTSMRDVAEAAGLPLATLVYHFARKEDLHGAVLKEIAAQILDATKDEDPIGALVRWSLRQPARVKLLLRELLDNPARVSQARSLPLAPVLTSLSSAIAADGHPEPELAVLHIVGAVSYVIAARPTVRRIVGRERETKMMEDYEGTALSLARMLSRSGTTDAARTTDRDGSTDLGTRRREDNGLGPVSPDDRHRRVRRRSTART